MNKIPLIKIQQTQIFTGNKPGPCDNPKNFSPYTRVGTWYKETGKPFKFNGASK